jgi:hypothetical protein
MSATVPFFAPAPSVADAVKASLTMHGTIASLIMLETVRRDIRVVVEVLAKMRDEARRDANEILDCDISESRDGDEDEVSCLLYRADGIAISIREIMKLLPEAADSDTVNMEMNPETGRWTA